MMSNAENLVNLVIHAMEDRKAQNIRVLNVRDVSSVTDTMIIASGTSNRQVVSIAQHVMAEAKQQGRRPLGIEGETQGEWVLLDLGDVVVHVMQPQTRDFYQLEKLWSDLGGQSANVA